MSGIRETKSDIWIGGGLLALCAFAAWRTLYIRRGFTSSLAGPSFIPWIMIIAIAVLAVALIWRALHRQRTADGTATIPAVSMPDRRTLLRLAAFMVLLIAYSAAFFSVGYIPATLATFILGLWLIGERKLWALTLFPVVMTGIVYFAFTEFLSVWLP